MVFVLVIVELVYKGRELDDTFYLTTAMAILEKQGNQSPSEDDSAKMISRVKMFFQSNDGLPWRTQLKADKLANVSRKDAQEKLITPIQKKALHSAKKSAANLTKKAGKTAPN